MSGQISHLEITKKFYMPIGLSSPTIGLISYTVIKVIGYSLAGVKLNQWYQKTKPRPYVFGVARALLGLVVGITFLSLLGIISLNVGVMFFIFLIPIRFFEWFIVLYIFYGKSDLSFKRIFRYSFFGIAYSFLLDIPVIASFLIIPGGFWVC
jgi:hypothetical protein